MGNLVPLLALRRFQLLGHHPIAVAGGATGSIGDPSGKTAERQLSTPGNAGRQHRPRQGAVAPAARFRLHGQSRPACWTTRTGPRGVSFLDFLRDIGKHFSVNQMVAKESVRARMEDREAGISYTEFSYMLLQAFDFYHLRQELQLRIANRRLGPMGQHHRRD